MQTPPLFVWPLLGFHQWVGLVNLKMFLIVLINVSIKVTLTKSLAAIPLWFQWQKFIGLGLIWVSPDCDNSKLCKLEQYMTRI